MFFFAIDRILMLVRWLKLNIYKPAYFIESKNKKILTKT